MIPFSPLAKDVGFIWRLIRAHQWWHYKLPLALTVLFALAQMRHIPASALGEPSILLLLCGISAAIFASVIDDVIDIEQDKLASKQTPVMSLSSKAISLVIASSLCLVGATAILLKDHLECLNIYLAIIGTFTAYSLKPLRLKERGWFGPLCIAAGEHVLPALLAISILRCSAGCSVEPVWLFAVIAWAFAFGLRGIIWHQLADLIGDRESGCRTVGVALGAAKLRRLGEVYIFPVEICALLVFLCLAQNALVWWLLLPHALIEFFHYRYFQANMMVVAPVASGRVILFDYYRTFLPLALLLSRVSEDSGYWTILLCFLTLFSGPVILNVRNLAHIAKYRLLAFAKTTSALRRPLTIEKLEALFPSGIETADQKTRQ